MIWIIKILYFNLKHLQAELTFGLQVLACLFNCLSLNTLSDGTGICSDWSVLKPHWLLKYLDTILLYPSIF